MTSGRGWAYAGAVAGAAVSLAANVAHAFVPPAGAMAWSPPAGAVISAAWWPIALLIALEILIRVDWPDGWQWVLGRYAGLAPVAAVAAVVSYRHLSGLLASYGTEDTVTRTIGPLAIDGLMVMATLALMASRPAPVPDPIATEPDPIRARLLQAIAAAELPARPSADAIRRHLKIGAATARRLRDSLRTGAVETTTEGA